MNEDLKSFLIKPKISTFTFLALFFYLFCVFNSFFYRIFCIFFFSYQKLKITKIFLDFIWYKKISFWLPDYVSFAFTGFSAWIVEVDFWFVLHCWVLYKACGLRYIILIKIEHRVSFSDL